MKAKKRNENSMASNCGATRRIYMKNRLFDNLIEEAENLDESISKLVRHKIETFDKIKFLILREIKDNKIKNRERR